MTVQNYVFILLLLLLVPQQLFGQSYQILMDLDQGEGNIYQEPIAQLGDKFVFLTHSNNLNRLWITDGTEENTQVVLETSSPFELDVRQRIIENGMLYFYWHDSRTIYSFDGVMLTPLAIGVLSYGINLYQESLYFFDTSSSFNHQLMKISSDPNEPTFIAELGNANMKGLTTYNGKMIIMADNNGGTWLFESDGTTEGTIPFHELGKRSNANWEEQFMEKNGVLYFYYQSNNLSAPEPVRFYKTDGTSQGTVKLADTHNFTISRGDKSENRSVWFNDVLYTAGTSTSSLFRLEFWTSDGTIEGTNLVKNLTGNSDDSDPKNFVVFEENVYFSALKENGKRAIWKTDGTEEGTVTVFDNIFAGNSSDFGDWLTVYDNRLAFSGFNLTEGSEVWLSDGTEAGTFAVTDVSDPSDDEFSPGDLFAVNNLLYFNGWTPENGRELWVYDNGETTSLDAGAESNQAKVSVAPNPFTDKITFDLAPNLNTDGLELYITDAAGKLVSSAKVPVSGSLELNVSDFTPGVYFYHIVSQSERVALSNGKIVKMN